MKEHASTGTPIFLIIGCILLTLKLAGIGVVATWSWWWVLLPFYGPFIVVIVCLVVYIAWAIFANASKATRR